MQKCCGELKTVQHKKNHCGENNLRVRIAVFKEGGRCPLDQGGDQPECYLRGSTLTWRGSSFRNWREKYLYALLSLWGWEENAIPFLSTWKALAGGRVPSVTGCAETSLDADIGTSSLQLRNLRGANLFFATRCTVIVHLVGWAHRRGHGGERKGQDGESEDGKARRVEHGSVKRRAFSGFGRNREEQWKVLWEG